MNQSSAHAPGYGEACEYGFIGIKQTQFTVYAEKSDPSAIRLAPARGRLLQWIQTKTGNLRKQY